jgi:hypothetical protein
VSFISSFPREVGGAIHDPAGSGAPPKRVIPTHA